MDLKQALKEQYHAGLAMLAQCIEKCPDGMWLDGEYPRTFCRIAWHAAYFTHNYMEPSFAAFNNSVSDWPSGVKNALGMSDTHKTIDVEPYNVNEDAKPPTRQDVLEYISYVRGITGTTIDALDLDAQETGFPWYPNMTKLSHELMNLRHLQGHVGQLSELLMARGIDIDWIGKSG